MKQAETACNAPMFTLNHQAWTWTQGRARISAHLPCPRSFSYRLLSINTFECLSWVGKKAEELHVFVLTRAQQPSDPLPELDPAPMFIAPHSHPCCPYLGWRWQDRLVCVGNGRGQVESFCLLLLLSLKHSARAVFPLYSQNACKDHAVWLVWRSGGDGDDQAVLELPMAWHWKPHASV